MPSTVYIWECLSKSNEIEKVVKIGMYDLAKFWPRKYVLAQKAPYPCLQPLKAVGGIIQY